MILTTILKYELVQMNIILLHKEKKCLDARTNLSFRFGDWFYEERKNKKKLTSCIQKNLDMLINVALKLINCRASNFAKNH